MIKKYDEFINEEEGLFKNIILSIATFLSLGLSKIQAQSIKFNQPKLSIVDTCYKFNKKVKSNESEEQALPPTPDGGIIFILDDYQKINRECYQLILKILMAQ